jgi:hypothetical protein
MRRLVLRFPDGTSGTLALHPVLTVAGLGPGEHDTLLTGLGPAAIPLTAGDLPEFDDERHRMALEEAAGALARATTVSTQAKDAAALAQARRRDAEATATGADADRLARARNAAVAAEALKLAHHTLARVEQVHADAAARSASAAERAAAVAAVHAAARGWLAGIERRHAIDPADLVELEELLGRLRSVGAGAHDVRAVHAWATSVRHGTAPLRPEARALLDRDEVLTAEIDAAPPSPEDDPDVLAARTAIATAEAVGAELRAILEAGDLDADERAEIDAARGAQQAALLARYGFDSFLDYSIAISTGVLGAHARRKLDAVDRQLRELHAGLDDARRAADGRAAARHAARARLDEDIAAWLGSSPNRTGRPDEPAAAILGRHYEPPAALDELIHHVGAAAESAAQEARRCSAAAETAGRSRVEAERDVLTAREASVAAAADDEAAQRALEDAVQALERALEDVGTAARDAASAAVHQDECVQRLHHVEHHAVGAPDADELEAALRAAAARRAPDEAGVLVLLDPWPHLRSDDVTYLLTRLTQCGLPCRVLYVTADGTVVQWARALDRHHGWSSELRDRRDVKSHWWRPRRAAKIG